MAEPQSPDAQPPRHVSPPESRSAPTIVRLAGLALIAIAAYSLGRTGWARILTEAPDFEYFYKAGRSLVETGCQDPAYDTMPDGTVVARGTLDWYLPAVPRLLSLIGWLPYHVAGAVWLGSNLLAMLATVWMLGRHVSGQPPRDWAVSQIVPFALVAFFWSWEFRLNQINALTLVLIAGSFVCWQQGRSAAAGLWLGLATLLKVTPALLVVWFALKRQWRACAVAISVVLLFGPAADAVVFGPAETISQYHGWFEHAVVGGSARANIVAQREMDWRNQSVGAVLSRWLHPTNWATTWDNDPRWHDDTAPQTMNVANLPTAQVGLLATAISGLSLVGLIVLARRPAAALSPWALRVEWALFVLAMLWLMPVVRRYHLIWLLPALSVLSAGVHHLGRKHPWTGGALLAVLLIAICPASMLDRAWEARGFLLAMIPLAAAPLIALHYQILRNPGLLPNPPRAPNRAAAATGRGAACPASG